MAAEDEGGKKEVEAVCGREEDELDAELRSTDGELIVVAEMVTVDVFPSRTSVDTLYLPFLVPPVTCSALLLRPTLFEFAESSISQL